MVWWVATLLAGGFGCNGATVPLTDTASTSPDSGTPTEPSGPVSQASACASWLTCVESVSPAQLVTESAQFGPDSACWLDKVAAASCEDQCIDSLEVMLAGNPTAVACWSDIVPTAEALFTAIGESWSVMESTTLKKYPYATQYDSDCAAVFDAMELTFTPEAGAGFRLLGTNETVQFWDFACEVAPDQALTCTDLFLTLDGAWNEAFTSLTLNFADPDYFACTLSAAPDEAR